MEQQSWRATTGGVLSIVSGALGLGGMLRLIGSPTRPTAPRIAPHIFSFMGGHHFIIAVILGVLAVLAIVGGIFALKRKIWGLSLAGSIAAIFGSFPLGIASLILIVLSKREFE